MASRAATTRITREWERIRKSLPRHVKQAGPAQETSLFLWLCTIEGPPDSPYEGGEFDLQVIFADKYPFKPPTVTFLTKVYHPKVSETGGICLQSLKDGAEGGWCAGRYVGDILSQIVGLLQRPDPKDPVRADVAELLTKNVSAFEKAARQCTEKYASPAARARAAAPDPPAGREGVAAPGGGSPALLGAAAAAAAPATPAPSVSDGLSAPAVAPAAAGAAAAPPATSGAVDTTDRRGTKRSRDDAETPCGAFGEPAEGEDMPPSPKRPYVGA
eukprot:TRINITY_DN6665_c0_g1_i1.p1 TRINITY_DN6665_c0_g1~~TRINITY_DN6665_c0_g1_i1.p1  ORF type:complete len:273 (-),score=26.29 TRINITY_DN6665_c0_g1_i1:552-1370(-)